MTEKMQKEMANLEQGAQMTASGQAVSDSVAAVIHYAKRDEDVVHRVGEWLDKAQRTLVTW